MLQIFTIAIAVIHLYAAWLFFLNIEVPLSEAKLMTTCI